MLGYLPLLVIYNLFPCFFVFRVRVFWSHLKILGCLQPLFNWAIQDWRSGSIFLSMQNLPTCLLSYWTSHEAQNACKLVTDWYAVSIDDGNKDPMYYLLWNSGPRLRKLLNMLKGTCNKCPLICKVFATIVFCKYRFQLAETYIPRWAILKAPYIRFGRRAFASHFAHTKKTGSQSSKSAAPRSFQIFVLPS